MTRRSLVLTTSLLAWLTAHGPLTAQTVTEFAPSSNTTPAVWYETNITASGMASTVDLTGTGGNLETNQPLPIGAALLTTTTDNNDRANVGVFDSYGTMNDILASLNLSYAYHKASNAGQNLSAAPSLKLTIFDDVCDDAASAGDCFGLLIYEPTWNQAGFEGSSVAVPLDTWISSGTIDTANGLWWWTGGFGQPNTAGGPPLRTLGQWQAVFSSDFGDADILLIEVGVGSFNQLQIGYFDDVQVSHSFSGGYSKAYDFEPPPPHVKNIDTAEEFLTIQEAIDDADTLDGHILEMLVAEHEEGPQIDVTKSVTLRGGSVDVIKATGDTGSGGDARGWFLVQPGVVLTVQDLIFDGNGFLIYQGFRHKGSGSFTNCGFRDIKFPTYAGVGVAAFGDGPVDFTDCTFEEMGRIGVLYFGPGVAGGTFDGNTYTGKGVGDWLDYFVDLSAGATATFTNNTVSGNRGVASSDGSTSAGILVTTFYGPGTTGVFNNNILTDNTTGLFVGFDAADTSTVTANNNQIFGNDNGLINASSTTVVDAEFNYWGDASGPEDLPGSEEADSPPCFDPSTMSNVDGLGNDVTDLNVDYCPWLLSAGAMNLEVPAGCQSDTQISVELWMRDLLQNSTGFQAFLEYDDAVLTYRGDLSSYTNSPFPLHIQTIDTAEVAPGELNLDGSDDFGGTGTAADSLLATLVFDVVVECGPATVDFRTFVFPSELSFLGDPIATNLVNTPSLILDSTAPTVMCAGNTTIQCDESDDPSNTGQTTGMDNCDVSPTATFMDVDDLTGCNGTGTITRTWTVEDDCGNSDTCEQIITVVDTVDPDITCPPDDTVACTDPSDPPDTGVATATDNCDLTPDISFMDSVSNPTCPQEEVITRVWTAEDDCGNTDVCVQTVTVLDNVAPVLDPCPDDITVNADAASCSAEVTYTPPGATDNCDPAPTVICSPASGSIFPGGTTTVTCTAEDACNNESTCDFDVTVQAVNDVAVDIELIGVNVSTSRCIHFVSDDCGNTADFLLSFGDHDGDDLNENGIIDATEGTTNDPSTPARSMDTIEIGCGDFDSLCAKDEQHTQWDTSTLSIVGTGYVTDTLYRLDGGDTDNDGDTDINDVTFFIGEFGSLAEPGGCPYSGTPRDADFSNNGAVGSEDYSFLTANWLTMSSCACTLPAKGGWAHELGQDMQTELLTSEVPARLRAKVDLNADGVVDYRDVELFERQHGLPTRLSEELRAATLRAR